MATIMDPAAATFCNENIRRMADWIVTLKNYSDGCNINLPPSIINTPDVIQDGSPADGRTPITGAQVITFLNALTAFFAQSVQSGKFAQIQSVAVNPASPDFSDLIAIENLG